MLKLCGNKTYYTVCFNFDQKHVSCYSDIIEPVTCCMLYCYNKTCYVFKLYNKTCCMEVLYRWVSGEYNHSDVCDVE